MEVIRDPDLCRNIKEEVSQAEVIDNSNEVTLNLQELVSKLLLQSVYTEALRIHVSILIARTSTDLITVGGYQLPRRPLSIGPAALKYVTAVIYQAKRDASHCVDTVAAATGNVTKTITTKHNYRLILSRKKKVFIFVEAIFAAAYMLMAVHVITSSMRPRRSARSRIVRSK